MEDRTLFNNALQYHKYLVHNNSSNAKYPTYAFIVTRHVMFDDRDELTQDDMNQVRKVARWVKRYLKS